LLPANIHIGTRNRVQRFRVHHANFQTRLRYRANRNKAGQQRGETKSANEPQWLLPG
jgi:hypothetical protein